MQDRLRLKVNPPNVAVPSNYRDFYVNSDGDLVRESPSGVKETVAVGLDTRYDPAITGLTGGGASKLDGIVTAGVSVGRVQVVFSSGRGYLYRLTEGLDGAENAPNIVVPDDYNFNTNAKSWVLVSLVTRELLSNISISINNGDGGQSNLSAANLTGERGHSLPDVEGTLAALRSFVDSTAANAAVSVGDAWWDTTLLKARVRLS